MNSVLQALYATPYLNEFLELRNHNLQNAPLSKLFLELFQAFSNNKKEKKDEIANRLKNLISNLGNLSIFFLIICIYL